VRNGKCEVSSIFIKKPPLPIVGKADLPNRRIPPSELIADDGEVAMIGVLHQAEAAVSHGDLDGKIIL
jgi:hypothetical protein